MKDLPQPPVLLPGGKLPGQLLVVESIYHTRPEVMPSGMEARYSRWLKTDENCYVDELTVNGEWQQVQTGRLKTVGMMILRNLAGEDLQVVPTPKQRDYLNGLIIQIAFTYPSNDHSVESKGLHHQLHHAPLIFLPGETARFQPDKGVRVFLRCLNGDAPCVVTSFPA